MDRCGLGNQRRGRRRQAEAIGEENRVELASLGYAGKIFEMFDIDRIARIDIR